MRAKSWTLRILIGICLLSIFSCASGVLQYEEVEELEINEEYDKMIKVKEIEPKEAPKAELKPAREDTKTKKIEEKKAKKVKPKKKVAKKAKKKGSPKVEKQPEVKEAELGKKEPSLEDAEGFKGRRPVKDPFGVGEKIVLNIKYFAMSAGELTLESRNVVEVNERLSYHFTIGVKTHNFFSRIYEVDDWAETYMDYQDMVPYNLAVHVKESKQLKESRSVYDFKTGKANYWEKKVTKEKGEKNRKVSWDIQPFSQNVISAIFYLRTFTLRNGKKISFRVADAGKNILFKAEVVREERLKTDKAEMDTLVLKLEFEQDGVFKKTGDVFLWLTKDDRKFPVKVESKIKIGTLVGTLKELTPGRLR